MDKLKQTVNSSILSFKSMQSKKLQFSDRYCKSRTEFRWKVIYLWQRT